MSIGACHDCLRRSALVGFLSSRLSAVLGGYDRRLSGVLSLPEDDLIAAVGGRRTDAARRFLDAFEASAAIDSAVAAALSATCRHAAAYPGGLLALSDPPAVLYHTVDRERLEGLCCGPVVTVVGTRRPSSYGAEIARALGRGLAVAGVTVVSGLALGVDAEAHRGALEGGGRPLAVLAGGADVACPKANASLYRRIRSDGAIVSELPPGHEPLRWSFPARNRIMAGLAGLTVVVEAPEASGSLITAEFASQIGRDVGVVPGQVVSRRAEGGNRLLREGAAVIRSAQDALDEVLGVSVAGPPESRIVEARTRHDGDSPGASAGHAFDRARVAPDDVPDRARTHAHARGGSDTPELEAGLRRILDLVEDGEGVEAIARDVGLSPGHTRAALGRLELMGLVTREAFASYVRRAAVAGERPPILDAARSDPPLA